MVLMLWCSQRTEAPNGDEQSVGKISRKILKYTDTCVDQITDDLLARVSYIAVCRQMHGCSLWTSDLLDPVSLPEQLETSNLITWQD